MTNGDKANVNADNSNTYLVTDRDAMLADMRYCASYWIAKIGKSAINELISFGVIENHRGLFDEMTLSRIKNSIRMNGNAYSKDLVSKLKVLLTKSSEIMTLANEYMRIAENQGITTVSVCDNNYPINWRRLSSMPTVVYVKGDVSLLNDLSIHGSVAVVGSRSPSRYAQLATEKYVEELVASKIGIISGLAVGIDAVAHSKTLDIKGKTIAVTAGGPDDIYPPANKHLYNKLINEGLIISEMPPGRKAVRQYFPARNRLISGLSDAVLIMEAGEYSGTLHTASFGAAQGKDVFVLPNTIYCENAQGGLKLLADGASILLDAAVVRDSVMRECFYRQTEIKEFGLIDEDEADDYDKQDNVIELFSRQQSSPDSLSDEEWEKIIIEELSCKNLSADELANRVNLPFYRLSVMLGNLENCNKILMQHGKYVLTICK